MTRSDLGEVRRIEIMFDPGDLSKEIGLYYKFSAKPWEGF